MFSLQVPYIRPIPAMKPHLIYFHNHQRLLPKMNTKFESFLRRHIQYSRAKNDKHIKYNITELKDLIEAATALFKSEPALVEINPPCVIVGDIRGQFFDLLRMFALFSGEDGKPHGALAKKYVFLGNYVDRGRRSVECVSLVFALKICFPKKFLLLRGNHETPGINRYYGFYDELIGRFEKEVAEVLYNGFNEAFAWMPFAGLIGKKVLCMHGGISKHINTLDDIRNIPRPMDYANENVLAMDLLWADPMVNIRGFAPNTIRGVGSFFGENAVAECCEKLGLEMIVRGHQMMMTGYGFFAHRKCCTIFSAPRYNNNGNSGAVLEITDKGKIAFRTMVPEAEKKNEIRGLPTIRSSSIEGKKASLKLKFL